MEEIKTKICIRCNKSVRIDYFIFNKRFKKYGSYCKECRRVYASEWRSNNIEKAREQQRKNSKHFYHRVYKNKSDEVKKSSWLWKKYKIRYEEYNSMLIKQNAKCAICSADEDSNKNGVLHVDHNHETGKVRALLCHRCNLNLGHYEKNRNVKLNEEKPVSVFETYLNTYDT